jgi:hypothetical protein
MSMKNSNDTIGNRTRDLPNVVRVTSIKFDLNEGNVKFDVQDKELVSNKYNYVCNFKC